MPAEIHIQVDENRDDANLSAWKLTLKDETPFELTHMIGQLDKLKLKVMDRCLELESGEE